MTNETLDPKILGQLLLMQSVLNNLPDNNSIFSFVCKGLLDIPGILKVTYNNEKSVNLTNVDSTITIPIELNQSKFGELVLNISNFDFYKPYEHYLSNFVFMLGVILEERKQRQINELHTIQLEQLVNERTSELRLEKENLAESQRRFTDLMLNVKLLSVMLDANGNIIFCNNFLLNITGYTINKVLNKKWFELFLPKSIAKKSEHVFQTVINGKDIASNYESEIVTKHGEILTISWNNTLLRNAQKQIIGTASIGEDVTQRKINEQLIREKSDEIEAQNEEYAQINEELNAINQELIEAKRKAEESDRLKTAFLQNMSHEIRTPMNAIMGFSDILLNNFDDKAKLKKFSNIIRLRCNDLLDIINDILDIAKIESGQLTINTEEFNIGELFEELLEFFTEHQKRIGKEHLYFAYNGNLCSHETINTDKVKIKQIFINLISNAFKFTSTGSIEYGCKIDAQNKLWFYVTDTGIGIPPDKQKVVFERFMQLNYGIKMNTGGTGLGLPIVKGLIDLLGGEINIDSYLGKGSTFSFTIPFNKTTNNKPNIENVNYQYETFINKTILIVEDDVYNSEYLKEILSETGITIIETDNGKDAIAISISNPVDIVLMDVRLPDISGYDATQEIKKHKPDLPIIAQTAYALADEKNKALNLGCNDYISKPTNRELLLQLISKYLNVKNNFVS